MVDLLRSVLYFSNDSVQHGQQLGVVSLRLVVLGSSQVFNVILQMGCSLSGCLQNNEPVNESSGCYYMVGEHGIGFILSLLVRFELVWVFLNIYPGIFNILSGFFILSFS